LRVRIALHTGVADERDGDYFGPPVNRVARLLSAGHGGQILLSDAAYNLARDYLVHLEPEGKLRDLGEHRLKDLIYTEHIYQLIVPDLPKDFPPLRTHGVVTVPELSNLERRYHRIRHIGSGGMGEVYLVHHEALNRHMALKILMNQYANDEQFLERFRREAKSMAKLSHPNLVQVYDAGEGFFEGSCVSYMAMEYVSGGTLKELIRQ
jgi:Protein kinase domain